jgi:hypothetical protein
LVYFFINKSPRHYPQIIHNRFAQEHRLSAATASFSSVKIARAFPERGIKIIFLFFMIRIFNMRQNTFHPFINNQKRQTDDNQHRKPLMVLFGKRR